MHDRERCRELLAGLSELLDGEATQAVCAEIERHLADCPDCKVLVDTLGKTIRLYREQEEGLRLPSDIRQRLYAALDIQEHLPPNTKRGQSD